MSVVAIIHKQPNGYEYKEVCEINRRIYRFKRLPILVGAASYTDEEIMENTRRMEDNIIVIGEPFYTNTRLKDKCVNWTNSVNREA